LEGSVIEIHGLRVERHERALVRGVTALIPDGAMCAFVGPSGAGKSVLLLAIAGGIEATEGSVRVGGLEVGKWPAKGWAQRCAYLSQSAAVNLSVSVREVASLNQLPGPKVCAGRSTPQAVQKALELMGVAQLAERHYGSLSHGEQRRTQVARVLAHSLQDNEGRARYLILDEPEQGLTPREWKHLLAALRGLAEVGCTVVLSLHDLHCAKAFPGEVFLLQEGRILARGDVGQLMKLEQNDEQAWKQS
jgi:iron complex transport system ATP-binding protein